MKKFLTKFLDKKFWKFLLVGVANTLFGTAIMFLAYNLFSCSYWVSSAMNYIFGSVLSYFLNKYFTFQYKEKSFAVIAKFIVNICVCYGIAYGIAKPVVMRLLAGYSVLIRDNIAMIVGAGLFVILNYIGQRYFAFRKKEKTEG